MSSIALYMILNILYIYFLKKKHNRIYQNTYKTWALIIQKQQVSCGWSLLFYTSQGPLIEGEVSPRPYCWDGSRQINTSPHFLAILGSPVRTYHWLNATGIQRTTVQLNAIHSTNATRKTNAVQDEEGWGVSLKRQIEGFHQKYHYSTKRIVMCCPSFVSILHSKFDWPTSLYTLLRNHRISSPNFWGITVVKLITLRSMKYMLPTGRDGRNLVSFYRYTKHLVLFFLRHKGQVTWEYFSHWVVTGMCKILHCKEMYAPCEYQVIGDSIDIPCKYEIPHLPSPDGFTMHWRSLP